MDIHFLVIKTYPFKKKQPNRLACFNNRVLEVIKYKLLQLTQGHNRWKRSDLSRFFVHPYGSLSEITIGLSYYWSVGWPVCHNFLKGREVSLPCSYRSTCLFVYLYFLLWLLWDWYVSVQILVDKQPDKHLKIVIIIIIIIIIIYIYICVCVCKYVNTIS